MERTANIRVGILALVSSLGGVLGCALDADMSDEPASQKSQEVFGGEPATNGKFDPVGAIAVEATFDPGDGTPPFNYFDLVCTGTLIDSGAVLTARHCTQALANAQASGLVPYFLLGDTAFEPERSFRIEGWTEAPASPSHPGLLYDGGRDIAVAYLDGCPRHVKPAKLGEFKPKDLGRKFGIVGFGYNDLYLEEYGFLDIGTKVEGEVTARALKGRWYELLFHGDYDAYLNWYLADAVTDSPTEDEAQAWWDAYTLEPGYELLAGGLESESLGCYGDSGGPLYALDKSKNMTVVGVSFATEASKANTCMGGGGYAILNKDMRKFVDRALKHRRP